MKLSIPFTCLLSFLACITEAQLDSVVQLHGSGTSNPDRCYWHVLETMNSQTKITTRGTYRSTSSGPGQIEFMGNITHPFTHFASSDYPLPTEKYKELNDAGQEIVHLPVLMGAIGIFHNVPIQTDENNFEIATLNLTSCLVARIFSGDITDWKHEDIVAINPALDIPIQLDNYGQPKEDQSFPIKLVHRVLGSSSTFAFTKYLHKSCPEVWGSELAGSRISWPMESNHNNFGVQGTSSMIATIGEKAGAIGYADAGLALDQGLSEVALKMDHTSLKNDFYLTTENALSKDGILATLSSEGAAIPDAGDADWSNVDLINQVEGYIYAWPMVLMTYILVRKDLPSVLPDPRAQTFLKAFLKNMYNSDYVQKCEEEFLFIRVEGELRDMAMKSIDMLVTSTGAPEWTQETSVLTEGGQGDYVISSRRKQATTIQQNLLSTKLSNAEHALEQVLGRVSALELNPSGQNEEEIAMERAETMDLLESQDDRLDKIYGMALASLILWAVSFLFMCYQQAKMQRLEKTSRTPIVVPITPRKSKRSSDRPEI